MIQIAHLLDDFAMGGVTRALSLFDEPRLREASRSVIVPMQRKMTEAPALKADVIVIHVPPCFSRLPYLAALRYRNPSAHIVQVEHSYTRSFEQNHVPSRIRFRLLLKTAASLVDEVVAVSKAQATWLTEVGIDEQKISTINPWSGRFELLEVSEWRPHSGPLKLLSYGRFCHQKNFGALVEAMGAFSSHEVELTLFGSGPERTALLDLAAGMPNVRIEPACDNPAAWLEKADAVIMPSRREAFGLVATEARMAGRAILVSDVDGLPEQANAGGGLVAPMSTAEEIASAIRSLSQQDLGKMGRASRAGVYHQHDEIIQGWENILERSSSCPPCAGLEQLRKLASV
ncbi:glycosyltransferase family 4 protein [Qipengyuania flava]|nr:glycosyltransferase family 4 protein [Qipengyuania flava]